jgi:arylformamidase
MIDITVPLRVGMDVWEGDPPFETELFCTVAKDGVNVSKLSLSAHAGSHVDAPYHFFNDGLPADALPLDGLMGECQVIFVPDSALVDRRIPAAAISEQISSARILLKTSNSQNPGVFKRDAVALSLDVAQLLVEKGVRLVGVDGLSVENASGDGSVHRALLASGVIVVETLDLSAAEPGRSELICLPIKVVGGDAAPLRAILRPLT